MPVEVEADVGGPILGSNFFERDGAGEVLFYAEVNDFGAVAVAGEKMGESEQAEGGYRIKK